MIPGYKIESADKTFASAYKEKVLEKRYHRVVKNRKLLLSKEECDAKYGVGEFFHLNTHTHFSLMSGVDEPETLFNKTKELGFSGLAVTESGYMSSIPDCHISAQATKLKYIPGICAWFSDYEIKRREIEERDVRDLKNHPALIQMCQKWKTPYITLLAKNERGYKDILNLNTESWKDGYYYTPRVNRKMLQKYAGNIIILSGNLLDKFIEFGYIRDIENKDYGALSAYGYLKWMHDTFGKDFYVENTMYCQDTPWGSDLDRMMTLGTLLESFKEEFGTKLQSVITNDVRYINRSDESLYRAIQAISRNSTIKKIKDYSSELYMKTRSELRATFDLCHYNRAMDRKDFEQGCDNSVAIAAMCDPFKADMSPKLPNIANADAILKEKVCRALIAKGLHQDDRKFEVDGKMVTHTEQVKIELNRFAEKGFSSYFLIMQDLVNHSRNSGYEIGPGRGSSAGSLVCYLLGITKVNPLLFMLSFNRFLSESRGGHMLKVSME